MNHTAVSGLDRVFTPYQIRDCVLRVARAVDRLDADLLRSGFWPDATVRYGRGSVWSTDEFVKAWFNAAGPCSCTQHHLFNHTYELAGNTATAESYYIAVFAPERAVDASSLLPFCGAIGAGHVAFQGGRYIDRFERRAGVWRILERRVVGEWFALADGADAPVPRPASAGPAPALASRDRQDPSYQLLDPASAHDPVEQLLSAEGVSASLLRYARGLDRRDSHLLASAFASGTAGSAARDGMVRVAEEQNAQSHYMTNVRVGVEGKSASAEAYFMVTSLIPAWAEQASTAPAVQLVGGRHLVRFTREAADWRIAYATTVVEWCAGGDGRYAGAFARATGNRSRRDRNDPSYDPTLHDSPSRTIRDLQDREEIRACLADYAHAVDRLELDLIASTFADDASDFAGYMVSQAPVRPVQSHYWTNLRVALDEDTAAAEAYYLTVIQYADGAGPGLEGGITTAQDLNMVGGRYIVPFVRTGEGRWAIKHRGNVGEWHAVVSGAGRDAFLEATGNTTRLTCLAEQ